MASGRIPNYLLVDNNIALNESINTLKNTPTSALLAVDCEGVDLSRKGKLTIVTVATEERAFIFDVIKLKEEVFAEGLREILEDKSRAKLMFDCRQDSDSLWYQYRVKLNGVLDVQLQEVLKRREQFGASASSGANQRRSQRLNEVENIYGLNRCIKLYLDDEEARKTKEGGTNQVMKDKAVWQKRPISGSLLRYCAVDTLVLFKLYKVIGSSSQELAQLRVASERYADMYRAKSERSFDRYEMNAYLPLDIISCDESAYQGIHCTGCKRIFPREEFSKNQLSKAYGVKFSGRIHNDFA
ncbi:Exonuclease 3'-5' domain-containing protein 1 [Exaiptasia diaphana]|nr:Exonuclease 3'-5' domain-containing protein 1 [Exaiptasia diaphana]